MAIMLMMNRLICISLVVVHTMGYQTGRKEDQPTQKNLLLLNLQPLTNNTFSATLEDVASPTVDVQPKTETPETPDRGEDKVPRVDTNSPITPKTKAAVRQRNMGMSREKLTAITLVPLTVAKNSGCSTLQRSNAYFGHWAIVPM